uniref:Uncharacterized protein n=1 Tax=Oryza meridionalis TaxID=40149 RepID=A0A0E0CFS8_9ORYZ
MCPSRLLEGNETSVTVLPGLQLLGVDGTSDLSIHRRGRRRRGGDRRRQVVGFAAPFPSPGLPPPPAAPLLHRAACRRATATPFDCSTQCQGSPGGAEAESLLLRCLRRRAQGVRRNARESLVQSWSVATSAVEDLVEVTAATALPLREDVARFDVTVDNMRLADIVDVGEIDIDELSTEIVVIEAVKADVNDDETAGRQQFLR